MTLVARLRAGRPNCLGADHAAPAKVMVRVVAAQLRGLRLLLGLAHMICAVGALDGAILWRLARALDSLHLLGFGASDGAEECGDDGDGQLHDC